MPTIKEILSNPSEFDSKEIEVEGLYINEREHSAIYDSNDDIKSRKGIWIVEVASFVGGPKKAKNLNRKNIRIKGVFHNRVKGGAGHFRGWPAEIKNIKAITQMNLDPA
jgi:hypothetical protein